MEKKLSPVRLRASYKGVAVFCMAGLAIVMYFALTTNGLGPIDDHRFILTIFHGKSFGAYVSRELGRFVPLTSQEYSLAAKLAEPNPGLFHVIASIKVFISGVLLFYCLRMTGCTNLALAALWFVVAFSVGFGHAAIRLQIGEINALLLSLVFLGCILLSQKETSDRRPLNLTVGLLAFAMAFLYKELAFVFAIVFAIAEIIRNFRQRERRIPAYLWILLALGLAYISGYLVWRGLSLAGTYAGSHKGLLFQIARDYARNDPFIVFIVLPIAVVRLAGCIRCAREQTIYDSMLFSAIAYFACYLVLRMFNTYYLLPAYGFAACGLAGILAVNIRKSAHSLVALVVLLLAANNATIAFADMRMLRLTANNHYAFVQFLSGWIRSNPSPDAGPRNLVLVGVSPGSGVEILTSLKTFLRSLGTPDGAFNVRGTEQSDNRAVSDLFGLPAESYAPRSGDLLIFNPYHKLTVQPPLDSPSYQGIYHSNSDWAPPRWAAWEWLRLCLLNPSACEARLASNGVFAGYTALLTKRSPAALKPRPLKFPKHALPGLHLPDQLESGSMLPLEVRVRNAGPETWPAKGALEPGFFVHMAYQWRAMNGRVVLEGSRTPFPEPILPGELVAVRLFLNTPENPGYYWLVLSPVQEGVCWFPDESVKLIRIY